MILRSATFRCMGKRCKAKKVFAQMPSEQPWCDSCHAMPMELIAVKASSGQKSNQQRRKPK